VCRHQHPLSSGRQHPQARLSWIWEILNASNKASIKILLAESYMYAVAQGFLRHFMDPIRVPRIENQVPTVRENHDRVPRIKESRVPIIREIGSLQVHIGYLTFSWKKPCCSLYVSQKNLIVKSSTKLGGGEQGASQKSGGSMAHS